MDSYINQENLNPIKQHILIKFTPSKIVLEITNEKSVMVDYDHIVYLNSSITNKNFFCLAYLNNNTNNKYEINGLVLYSKDGSHIDDTIREYALKISTELNGINTKRVSVSQHTCILCPMQQYIELCQYLNTFQGNDEKIYQILNEKINHNLEKNDQNYLLDCLNEQNLNINSYAELANTNQLLVALIQKLCKSKHNQHILNNFNPDYRLANDQKEFSFFLMKNNFSSKQSLKIDNNNENISETNNLQPLQPILPYKKRNKTQRSNTIETSQCVDSFDKNLLLKKSNNNNNINNLNDLFIFANKKKPLTNHHQTNMFTLNSKIDSSIRRYIFSKIVGTPNNLFINNAKPAFETKQEQQQLQLQQQQQQQQQQSITNLQNKDSANYQNFNYISSNGAGGLVSNLIGPQSYFSTKDKNNISMLSSSTTDSNTMEVIIENNSNVNNRNLISTRKQNGVLNGNNSLLNIVPPGQVVPISNTTTTTTTTIKTNSFEQINAAAKLQADSQPSADLTDSNAKRLTQGIAAIAAQRKAYQHQQS